MLESLDLNLSHNKLEDTGVKYMSKAILEIKTLRKLRVAYDWCLVTAKGCLYVGRMISELPELRDLELSLKHNEITHEGV